MGTGGSVWGMGMGTGGSVWGIGMGTGGSVWGIGMETGGSVWGIGMETGGMGSGRLLLEAMYVPRSILSCAGTMLAAAVWHCPYSSSQHW